MTKERILSELTKDKEIVKLSSKYLEKANNNLMTMNLLYRVKTEKDVKEKLSIPDIYYPDDWIVITGYYSMYLAATALLAKIGYKSKQHTATIEALEHFFVKKKLLEQYYVDMLKFASLSHDEVHNLRQARMDRETAQYGISESITSELVNKTIKNTRDFVAKVSLMLSR